MGSNPLDHVRGGHLAIGTVAFDPQERRSGLLLELNQLDGRFGDVEQRSEIEERFANATVDIGFAYRFTGEAGVLLGNGDGSFGSPITGRLSGEVLGSAAVGDLAETGGFLSSAEAAA